MKMDAQGNILWKKSIGRKEAYEWGGGGIITTDNKLLSNIDLYSLFNSIFSKLSIRSMTLDLSYLSNSKIKFHLRTDEVAYLLQFLKFVTSDEVSGLFESEKDRAILVGLGLKLAKQADEVIAATLSFKDKQCLYGRYWGANDEIDSLHFELCYYQGIEYCIKHGLACFLECKDPQPSFSVIFCTRPPELIVMLFS